MGHRSNDDSDALDPDAIADQRFPVRFRGYDKAAVARHLARVADAHRSALRELADVELALRVDRQPTEPTADDQTTGDEPELSAAVAEVPDDAAHRFDAELAEVIGATRLRVVEIEETAQRRADDTVMRAEQKAARIVQAAQARADHLTAVHDRLVARLVDARTELAEVLERLDDARLDHVRSDTVIDLSDPPADDASADDDRLESEDDPAFDRMVRDALERAVRLGRAHSDDS